MQVVNTSNPTELGELAPEGARYVPLTRFYRAIVDAEDFERVAAIKWQILITKRGYIAAVRARLKNRGPRMMSRFIMDALDSQFVDHKNGNTLDNRRTNLRLCTRCQNGCNARKLTAGHSQYKGVTRHRQKWIARIIYDRTKIRLGQFDQEEDAARAYDDAARRYHGEFASVNFPANTNERCALRNTVPQ